jgi:hypothetical protein
MIESIVRAVAWGLGAVASLCDRALRTISASSGKDDFGPTAGASAKVRSPRPGGSSGAEATPEFEGSACSRVP